MKKIAIVADNYKLDSFKKELSKGGFSEITTTPFVDDTTTISIKVADADFKESTKKIHNICKHVELHFKRGN